MSFFTKHNPILIFCFFTLAAPLFSQNKLESDTILVDSVKTRKHSPTLATLMSVAIPGAGQVYNKKYWKVPIIYAGMGTSIYFALSNHKSYKQYKDAYLTRLDEDETTVDEFDGLLTDENLKTHTKNGILGNNQNDYHTIREGKILELKNIKKIKGSLGIDSSNLESLGEIEEIYGDFFISKYNIII